MATNWKEQFINRFALHSEVWNKTTPVEVADFISTEIIEKLIADIPEDIYVRDVRHTVQDIKQQLRERWLE